jgi:spore maturation protein CgeB
MDGPRLKITAGMRALMDYRKFAGRTRMLILETQYFFDKSWICAAESLGWETAAAPSAMVGDLTRDDIVALFTSVGEFKPDFILASNYAGMDMYGMFSRFFEDVRIPYVSWFTDTPRMILFDRQVYCSHYSVAATWERAYTGHFRELGFEHVFYMPLATDPALFNGEPAEHCPRPLAFVGTSMIGEVNEAWEKLAHLPHVIQAVHHAFDARRVTRERFAQGIQAILDVGLFDALSPSERRNVELCIIYEATRRQRADLVQRLAPLGLEVRGDPEWLKVYPRADGPVGYYTDLASFYRDTSVNVNTTSLQMKSAVNQRVFDCPAAGGFLITDAQGDLEELFEPDEVVTYSSLDELNDKATYYLAHPEQRVAVVRRAQRRIGEQHTHAHRLHALEGYLKERYEG